ncbi:glucose 1-dehydrogenase [Baekduia soli]|uniref:Glucose 1-dehydrogenase n=1 Tax=Baekduia soli TaxID=496014 RepID=A0A5B8U367_9ACTN|nr:glucose 1-dehydrogenase [Baekduia soli]QEC47381.1 glucose 1-dehydrogenase [Baekduia soli]
MAPAQRLTGRTAIVTGAGSGMGRASVERFLDEGATVVAVDIASAGLATLPIPDGRGHTAVVDVTDVGQVQAVVDETVQRYGRLDVYFNNAGVAQRARPVEDTAVDEWYRVLDVNLTAAFLAARAVLPHMRAQKAGVFIVNASTAGLRPRPNLLAYNAAKAGVIGLARSIAIEAGGDNVRANVICPVAANTPMLEQFGYGTHEETAALLTSATPLGRVAEPEEIAAAAAFLASDDAAFLTGVVLPVDGGRTI